MEELIDQLETYPDLSMGSRQEVIVNVRRFLLAAMESGNPSAARSVMRELQAVDLQAWYSLRAEIVGAYGIDI
jgi:DNA-binding FadR family transcriptional regulator